MKTEKLYGKNPVREALKAGRRRFKRLWVLASAREEGVLGAIAADAQAQGIPVAWEDREVLRNHAQSPHHQGVVAEVSTLQAIPWQEWKQGLKQEKPSILLALDQIQDPQNLGAILRSAEATGVAGVLIPERHSAPLTPAVSKASAGALEFMHIISIKNLAQALEALKKLGFWIVGSQAEANTDAMVFDWPSPMVLVLGGEGPGMRRLTTEKCDFLLQLPLLGRISSLNVAQAATAFLYLRLRSTANKP